MDNTFAKQNSVYEKNTSKKKKKNDKKMCRLVLKINKISRAVNNNI